MCNNNSMQQNSNDIRWIQRFENLKKSLLGLEVALKIKTPDIVQKAGIIQFFEMTFELSWKTMKDYLEYNGFEDLNSPRAVIKKAFQVEVILDGHEWMDCLEKRNQMSHVYDEQTSIDVENNIRNVYYKLVKDLVDFFEKHLTN